MQEPLTDEELDSRLQAIWTCHDQGYGFDDLEPDYPKTAEEYHRAEALGQFEPELVIRAMCGICGWDAPVHDAEPEIFWDVAQKRWICEHCLDGMLKVGICYILDQHWEFSDGRLHQVPFYTDHVVQISAEDYAELQYKLECNRRCWQYMGCSLATFETMAKECPNQTDV